MDQERIINYIDEKLVDAPILSKNSLKIDETPLEYRNIYFKIKEHIDNYLEGYIENRFLTLAGLRGIGKTTLLLQIHDYLTNEKKIAEDRVLYIPADELEGYVACDLYKAINVFIEEIHETRAVSLEKEIFILIDEAQYDKNWSKTGKILYDKTKKIFLIFTGSSALNFEMDVDAVRRIKKESVFPLNFHEYNRLKNKLHPPKDYEDTLINLILNGNLVENFNESLSRNFNEKLSDNFNEKLSDNFNEKLSENLSDNFNENLSEKLNEDMLKNMRKKENEMRKKLLKLNKSLKKEHEKFLLHGSFPFGLNMEDEEIHRRTFNMIDRIIEKDIFSLQTFSTNSRSTISQIITYLALQYPGGTSDKKLATILARPQKSIREILNVLEKTHLLFPVKPYGGPGKLIRKPWKYYFLSPSINTSIRYRMGKYRKNDRKFLGLLAENYIASYFFKIKQTENQYLNIFYDSSENGVDFLLETVDNIIPVEVSIGKKDKKQIRKAINKYKSNYGVIISNTTGRIEKRDNILHIPLISIP